MSHYPQKEDVAADVKEDAYVVGHAEAEVEVETHYTPEVHPISQRLFDTLPFIEHIPILGDILKAYSPGLVAAVGLERVFVKGVIHSLMRKSIQPMLTERYGLSAAVYQKLSSLYTLGWSVNCFFTAITDAFALFGYTKRWYAVMCTIGGGIFGILYALLPAKEASGRPAAGFMFLMALFLANVDVFAAAVYSRRIRRNPASGSAMVSWAWAASHIGAIVGTCVQGPLSDKGITQVGVYIAAGVLASLSLMFIFNILDEEPNRVARVEDAKIEYVTKKRERAAQQTAEPHFVEEQELMCTEPADEEEEEEMEGFVEPEVRSMMCGMVEMNLKIITRNWTMMLYCCLMTVVTIITAVVTILGTHWDMLYCACVMTVVVCVSAFFALPMVVAKAAVFTYFFHVLYISLPGVLNTFYVAKPACLPDGPHFTYTFYNITSGIVGDVASVLGIAIFSNYCQNFSYRGMMGASAILLPLTSIVDLMMVKRWNTYIGIPDTALYIFGDALVADVIDFMLRMPSLLLISRVAPRGSESMVIALLDSILHLGSTTSTAIGYALLSTIWPIKSKGKCDYHNAPWLIIAGHMVAPLLILPLSFLLLPSARVSATLDENGNEVEEVHLRPTKKAVSATSSEKEGARAAADRRESAQ